MLPIAALGETLLVVASWSLDQVKVSGEDEIATWSTLMAQALAATVQLVPRDAPIDSMKNEHGCVSGPHWTGLPDRSNEHRVKKHPNYVTNFSSQGLWLYRTIELNIFRTSMSHHVMKGFYA